MPEVRSTFHWSRIVSILLWPATWLSLLMCYFLCCNAGLGDGNGGFDIMRVVSDPLMFVFLPIWGLQIAGSILLLKTTDLNKVVVRLNSEFFCAVVGPAVGVAYYLAWPGYMVPFLNSPNWRMLLFGLIVWQLVGLLVLFRAQKYWTWLVTVICFSLPLALLMRIGPYMLIRSLCTDEKFAEVLARPDYIALSKIDCLGVIAFVVIACASFPGIWTKLFRLGQKPALASS